MIEEGVFKNHWALLIERFRMTGDREPTQLMMREYYRQLSPRLTTEQFEEAARQIYFEAEFFPRPADFVEVVIVDPEVAALEQWSKVRSLLRDFSSPLTALDRSARRAVQSMGGLSSIGADVSALQFRRKEFIEAYAQYAGAEPEHLPQLTSEGRETVQRLSAGVKELPDG